MIILPNGEFLTDDEDEKEELQSLEEEEEVLPVDERVGLVVRRALATQVKAADHAQRENIFYTRCYTKGKLNDSGDVRVTKQVQVPFRIGKYEDVVLYDVVPMQACHILLGRPWQFDKGVTFDGITNKYFFKQGEKRIVLVPLTPIQVCEDQESLIKESELENEKKKIEKVESSTENDKAKKIERKKTYGESAKIEKREKRQNLLIKANVVRKALSVNKPIFVLLCKEVLVVTSDLTNTLSSSIVSFLQDYEDVFPDEIPNGLPSIRGVEQQIDLVPGAPLPKRLAYNMGPDETKELQSQIEELLTKGWARESLSPYVVPVILCLKRIEVGECALIVGPSMQ
ncbi:uncharacterized protein LOC113766362 [Coffea eugenioides]|uniref:uncharacterized protein LOC113766362 n=1 Tax=Coffea eugenioides TaxID=49369 RepID=UPI000F60B814|nr:uncharacterized protein LOC113766362 [Coffea eugenioides]